MVENVESTIGTTEYDWDGGLSLVRYFDTAAVIVHASYDVAGASLLVVATDVCLAVGDWWFRRSDL